MWSRITKHLLSLVTTMIRTSNRFQPIHTGARLNKCLFLFVILGTKYKPMLSADGSLLSSGDKLDRVVSMSGSFCPSTILDIRLGFRCVLCFQLRSTQVELTIMQRNSTSVLYLNRFLSNHRQLSFRCPPQARVQIHGRACQTPVTTSGARSSPIASEYYPLSPNHVNGKYP
jgi:hypothetical protein